jgi:hypothetical protein
MTDLFRCKPISTVLSRSACGARYERKIGQTCATCAVGRQHARGALPTTWADGSDLLTAEISVATMASLRVHLAIIESRPVEPRRGMLIEGATIREHAERAGIDPAVIRSRIVRGEAPASAIEPRLRGAGRFPAMEVRYGRQTLTLRGLARALGKEATSVRRWLMRGMTVEQIAERCE